MNYTLIFIRTFLSERKAEKCPKYLRIFRLSPKIRRSYEKECVSTIYPSNLKLFQTLRLNEIVLHPLRFNSKPRTRCKLWREKLQLEFPCVLIVKEWFDGSQLVPRAMGQETTTGEIVCIAVQWFVGRLSWRHGVAEPTITTQHMRNAVEQAALCGSTRAVKHRFFITKDFRD